MAKRRLFAWTLIVANILAQMPGVPPADRAVAASGPQTLQNSWSGTSRAPVPVADKLATPYPVLPPRRPMSSAVVVQQVDPRTVASRIAGVSYARIAATQHLAPQALGVAGARVTPRSSQPSEAIMTRHRGGERASNSRPCKRR